MHQSIHATLYTIDLFGLRVLIADKGGGPTGDATGCGDRCPVQRCVYRCPTLGVVLEYVDSSVWNELAWECTYPQWGGDAAAAEFFVPGLVQCLSASTQQFYGCSWEGPFLYDTPGQG